MAWTGSARGDTSRMRSTRSSSCCKQCSTAGCCCCCKNWCHVCGVAKCRAARESKWLNDALNTEYKREFPPKSVIPEKRIPGHGPLDSLPFRSTTTNRVDYTPKHSRSQSARAADKPIPPHRLDDGTTYKAHFPPKRAQLESPANSAYPAWSAPFVGVSTYNAEYIPRKVRPWTAEPPLPPPVVALDSSTEYKDEFYRKRMPPKSPRASQPLLPSNHVPTITTYGHDYVPKPFEERERLHCCDDASHPADYAPPITCAWAASPRGKGGRLGLVGRSRTG